MARREIAKSDRRSFLDALPGYVVLETPTRVWFRGACGGMFFGIPGCAGYGRASSAEDELLAALINSSVVQPSDSIAASVA